MKPTYFFLLILSILSIDLYAQGSELDKKIAGLTEQIEAAPDNIELYKSRAEAYQQNDQADKAMADYEQIVTLYSKNPINKEPSTVALAYYKLSDNSFTKKNSPLALEQIRGALGLKPQEKIYLLQEARVLASMPDKKDEAIAKFDNLVAAYPTDEKILLEYGSFIKKWDPAKAVILFEKILRVNIMNVDALKELGKLYSNLAKQTTSKERAGLYRDKAISYLTHLHNLRPEDTDVTQDLIELLNLQGRSAEANALQAE